RPSGHAFRIWLRAMDRQTDSIFVHLVDVLIYEKFTVMNSRPRPSARLLRPAFAAPAHKLLSIYPHRATLRFAIGLSHDIISRVLLGIVLKDIESGGPLPLTFHVLQRDLAGRRDFTCFLPFG